MSHTVCHLFSEHDTLRITAVGDGAVWVRSRHTSVSLTLDAADRAKLRAALDSLDEIPTELNVDTEAPVAPGVQS